MLLILVILRLCCLKMNITVLYSWGGVRFNVTFLCVRVLCTFWFFLYVVTTSHFYRVIFRFYSCNTKLFCYRNRVASITFRNYEWIMLRLLFNICCLCLQITASSFDFHLPIKDELEWEHVIFILSKVPPPPLWLVVGLPLQCYSKQFFFRHIYITLAGFRQDNQDRLVICLASLGFLQQTKLQVKQIFLFANVLSLFQTPLWDLILAS